VLARILKIVSGIGAVTAVGFTIWHFRLWEKDWSTIDDGWASLIGSAMGSFLAVVGALYVSKAEERRKKKEFEDFVRVAVQNLVVQASYLEAMAREPHKIASTPEIQAGIISIQMRNLTDALAVFDREVSASNNGSFKLRREIVSTDAAFSETRPYLTTETTQPTQAINNWHIGAYQIRHYASIMLDNFGWIVPIPTSNLIGESIKKSVAAWRSWNIPTDPDNRPSVTSSADDRHQVLHHAHA
jgi:hypothetical protein